jgi:2-polyprenyl-6-methoxyphenol hydroxylase-like FAD-dependent oxidoreductase
MIVITAPALHTPKKWPGFMERARQEAAAPESTVKKFDGTLIGTFPIGDPTNPSLAIYRSKLHKCLYEYALSLNIPMVFNAGVASYFESQDDKLGGVVLSDGRTLTADLVVAADGVGSKSWELVTGKKEAPISSGFVLYRVTFPAAPALENPVIAAELGGGRRARALLHAGPGAHVVSCLSGGEICWLMTCRVRFRRLHRWLEASINKPIPTDIKQEDSNESEENWAQPTSTAKALQAVQGWDPYVTELIKATPDNTVLDWKLMWRNPQPQWTSPLGRVVQIGDAAHPFLPTSASGGTMAMEDAFSLTACLQVAGKEDVGLATKVHNKLRYVLARHENANAEESRAAAAIPPLLN